MCTEPEGEGHTHSDDCRSPVLVCTEPDSDGHIHSDECRAEQLICTNDDPEHIHGPECQEQTLVCGQTEGEGHRHGGECFVPGEELSCGMEESAGHLHGEGCYAPVEDSYVCGLEETGGHAHGPECWQTGVGFGCGLTEAEGHAHEPDCVTEETALSCGQDYVPGHFHQEPCYEKQMFCELGKHIHQESCYSDITADLETEEDWERSLEQVEEAVTTAQQLVAVARSQLGYTESILNFEVDLHGVRRGITRYGQWYGNPYGDWSAMFASFCLHYAGVTELPANAGAESMRLEWEEAGLYASSDNGVPRPGSLIFLKGEPELRGTQMVQIGQGTAPQPDSIKSDGAGVVGIITNVSEEGITLIQGNLLDAVGERTVPMDDPAILGYGLVPEQSPYSVLAVPSGELHYIASLGPGEHTLTMMYPERGASHSNCAIYFNLAPRYSLEIMKEDVLSREVLNGAQFSIYLDLECTEPAELWESQESYLRGDPGANTFTVKDGAANLWGLGAGNTYYIKETRPPDDPEYGFPNGIIRMVLDNRGAATYSVMILDGGDGISGGFTVHGFQVDEEMQQACIVATNAPKWVSDVTSVEARKVWSDGTDHSGDSVTVYLTIHEPDGTVLRLQEAQLSDETGWRHLWENLPKFYEDGTPIQYGVEEAYVSGYYSKVEVLDGSTVLEPTVEWTQVSSIEGSKTYLLRNSSNQYLSTNGASFQWVSEAAAKADPNAQWTTSDGSGYFQFTNGSGYRIAFDSNSSQFYANNGNYNQEHLFVETSGSQVRLGYWGSRKYYMTTPSTAAEASPTPPASGAARCLRPMPRR